MSLIYKIMTQIQQSTTEVCHVSPREVLLQIPLYCIDNTLISMTHHLDMLAIICGTEPTENCKQITINMHVN